MIILSLLPPANQTKMTKTKKEKKETVTELCYLLERTISFNAQFQRKNHTTIEDEPKKSVKKSLSLTSIIKKFKWHVRY